MKHNSKGLFDGINVDEVFKNFHYKELTIDFLTKTVFHDYDGAYYSDISNQLPYDCIYYYVNNLYLTVIIGEKYMFTISDRKNHDVLIHKEFKTFNELLNHFNKYFSKELREYKLKNIILK